MQRTGDQTMRIDASDDMAGAANTTSNSPLVSVKVGVRKCSAATRQLGQLALILNSLFAKRIRAHSKTDR